MPRPGGTGICVHYVARELVNRGNTVTVICYDDENGTEELDIDGVRIKKINTPFFLKGRNAKSFIISLWIRIVSILSKVLYLRCYPLRSKRLIKEYKTEVIKLLKDNIETILISTFTPLEADVALLQIKNEYPQIKTIYYSTDTLSNEAGNSGILPRSVREYLGKRWELKFFSAFDKVIIMECHKDHYEKGCFIPFKKKMAIANFPLIEKPCIRNVTLDTNASDYSSKIKMIYAGALYRKLRNPSFLCDILISLGDKLDFVANFYGGGDCTDIMRNYQEKSKNNIVYNGLVSHTTVADEIACSDILLSIGNYNSQMMPSKIFEYMSTGKPIIHIYSWDYDPCLEPLRNYGNCLVIKDDTSVSINKIISFLKSTKCLEYEEVEKKFVRSTPAYTADIIQSV